MALVRVPDVERDLDACHESVWDGGCLDAELVSRRVELGVALLDGVTAAVRVASSVGDSENDNSGLIDAVAEPECVGVSFNGFVRVMLAVSVTVAVACCVLEVDGETVGRFEGDARVRDSGCVTDMLREVEYVAELNSVCVSDEDRTVAEISEVVERVGEGRVGVTDASADNDAVIV
jgi:hypothetical protein